MAKKDELTPQQEKFALGVASGKSQAESYREAYPGSKKWTENALYVKASKLMAEDKVRLRVSSLRQKVEEKTLVSAARVITEISRIAFFDIRKLVDANGRPKALNELDDDTAAGIAGIEVVSFGNEESGIGDVLKFKISDKNSGLDKLCRHLGLYKPETGVVEDSAQQVVQAMNNTNTLLLNNLLQNITKNAGN